MAHIAVLGLGNWGSAIAKLWLEDGHTVKGWTIENEVYESIMMEDIFPRSQWRDLTRY